MANLIMFCILAVIILGSAIVCVTTKRIMRAATFLLFVLFGVAGIYFLLGYTFLGAAQISIYAGGIHHGIYLCNSTCIKKNPTRFARIIQLEEVFGRNSCGFSRLSDVPCDLCKE